VYYYNQETGESTWEQPAAVAVMLVEETSERVPQEAQQQEQEALTDQQEETTDTSPSSKKRSADKESSGSSRTKRSKTTPKEVRVLHILKKHKDSRRPSSWRQAKITSTKEEAKMELQELLSILKESQTPEELRATMEELARTESDCSSAKRGGDLGFFGPKKMQPAFEQASFALEKGELSEIVETSSGVHIILRVG
jgi:NIMA-interacting peptidyl-prolyl cis-trans isomerase 1